MSKSVFHPDGLTRCPWPKQDPLYVAYHDKEWGVPEFDDRALFEKLVLDGFQAGLSWITILRKRENFRRATPPVIYSQPWSPTPSTTAMAPELRTAKRSPATPRK